MDRGRSSGRGGSKGLVAGVKAALRPRSHSSLKSHSKSSHPEAEDDEVVRQPNHNSLIVIMPSKNHKSPKSPFTGWKRSKSKEKTKKENAKSKDLKIDKYHPPRVCSQSQAERLSSHITDDYPSYGSDASEMLRDIRTGRYTSFINHGEAHERRVSNTVIEESVMSNREPWAAPVDPHYIRESESYGKETDYCFADNRYVNLPTSCFGVSCVRYSKNNPNGVDINSENHSENSVSYSNTISAYNYSVNHHAQINQSSNANSCVREIYDMDRNSEGKIYESANYSEGKSANLNPWEGNGAHEEGKVEEGQDVSEGGSCAVRVRGDGSEAQDIVSPEVKVEEELTTVGGPSTELERHSWLKSALTYNLEVPEFPRNEVVVLALGIDQYIEEVFRYLDQSGDGKVHVEDFRALCNVLGLSHKEDEEEEKASFKRCQCVGSNLTLNGSLNNSVMNINSVVRDNECPIHLSFAEFHDKLCENFIRGAKTETVVPLASRRPSNPRLVTSVVQVQRRYDVLDNIAKCLAEVSAGLDADENKMIDECPAAGIVCCKCQQSAAAAQLIDKNSNITLQPMDSESAFLQKQVLLQQQELQCLREVIEDMRVALQSSDAENLALQVKTLRSGDPSRGSSAHDLSLTDEEDTIDDLVRQLTALSRPPQVTQTEKTLKPNQNESTSSNESKSEPEGPNTSQDPLNTAFISGDCSVEKELQATYEALQAAREEREATQADLQKVVNDLQDRERDLRGAELSLQAAHTALEKVQYDNQALVMEIAETRSNLEDTRQKLMETTENLQQARESILDKERQLKEAHVKLNLIIHARERVVECVCSARNLVAGSLDKVRAGEQVLNSFVSFSGYSLQHDSLTQSKPTRLDSWCRADSGLYSEESEKEEDRKTPDRSTEHNSASEDDLWLPSKSKEHLKQSLRHNAQVTIDLSSSSCSPNSPSSPASEYENHIHSRAISPLVITELNEPSVWPKKPANGLASNSTEIIEGLEKELQHLQQTLDEAELECRQERVCPNNTVTAKEGLGLLEDELREVEAERMRLAIMEDKLRQLLEVLLSVADLNLSRRTLGRLVLEAVEDAAGIKLGDISFSGIPEQGKVSPITFLTNLLSSTSNYQGLSTESLMHLAFQGLSFPPCIPELPEPLEATLG